MKRRGQSVKLSNGSIVVVVEVILADSIQGYLAKDEEGNWEWYPPSKWEEIGD